MSKWYCVRIYLCMNICVCLCVCVVLWVYVWTINICICDYIKNILAQKCFVKSFAKCAFKYYTIRHLDVFPLLGFVGVNCDISKQSTTEADEHAGTKIEWNIRQN